MNKLFYAVSALIIFLFSQNVFADSLYVAIYHEPPDEKYEVIGNISSEVKVTSTLYDVIYTLSRSLQGKTLGLGGNALILGSIEHFTKVATEKENYNINPFQPTIYSLELFYKYTATAIKLETQKASNISSGEAPEH